MKDIMYSIGPASIQVGGLSKDRRDNLTGVSDEMECGVPVTVIDDKAADMLSNPMFHIKED
jgi:hypothetical protein